MLKVPQYIAVPWVQSWVEPGTKVQHTWMEPGTKVHTWLKPGRDQSPGAAQPPLSLK